ncbi:MAG: O-antigen ligase family protein, partial [Thermodesulfobacteriota bacterium]
MRAADRRVLRALQALVLALPLFLGGRHPLGVSLGLATVVALLLWTLRERARSTVSPEAPGVGTLAAFLALALATTLPLPPALVGLLSPDTAALYREMLPGWPDGGGWSAWRPLAFDAHGVWYELCRIGIGLGAFVVLVAYPWRAELDDDDPRLRVFGTLVLTLIAGGAGLAALALVHDATGSDRVLGFLDETIPGRASGPFVNPNHFAAWLEMVIPLGVAYLGAVAVRLGRRIGRMAAASRTMGVQPRRAWASALAASQRGLWLPLLLTGGVLLMLVAHLATGSRGGTISLLVGLAVVGFGFARPSRGRPRSQTARWVARAVVAALVVLSLVLVVSWARLEEEIEGGGAVEGGDVSLLTRISVSAKGRGILADFPVFGTGLGSWLHAFQLYQAPPVEGGIWQHAHNDYLELAAETGLAGAALAAWFALAVAAVARRRTPATAREHERRHERPAGFEIADWRAALASATWLRFGVLGAVAAILVHSLVDFGLRLPANLLLLFVVLAMLVLSRPPVPARDSRAVAAFTALLCLAIVPVLAGRILAATGGTPLA